MFFLAWEGRELKGRIVFDKDEDQIEESSLNEESEKQDAPTVRKCHDLVIILKISKSLNRDPYCHKKM